MFSGPNSMGFVWGGVGRALMQLMQFLVVFPMSCHSLIETARLIS